ncbi:NADH:ubiquinone reductase (Na(+)-transporting) subunit B [Prevotella ihumii]|uniref:NADH:ubiquinone reductase (Na(+)-transporting) subunit B n=1 Tax=Prevotella ihumii TaxID=1917878 RepID=UPI000980E03D|nr:NADH:ubiquinone reductase (Na(+)-transporting) subunit B [Prevotella ihumii]
MSLRNYLDKLRPNFEEGGKLHAFKSVYDGFDTFLYVPHETSKSGTSIHDAIDSKRIMSMVVIALIPAMLFGMYNIGYQNAMAAGKLGEATFMGMFLYGAIALLPKIVVSYLVGLGIEFAWAQWKGEEIQEGYLVSGFLIPLIVPVSLPLWMLALAVAFAVIFTKEIFGGTGMNIFNVALAARAFLFFSYPGSMTGDTIWVEKEQIFGLGYTLPDGFTMATPLGEIAQGAAANASLYDMIVGLIPGSVGETSVIAIAIGAIILIWTNIASWKTMLSVFLGGGAMALLFQSTGATPLQWYEHIVLGGFCFGAVFMATDPVTSARTACGKWFYGFLIGAMAVIIRVMNPGYPEGMMLAILFGNMVAPLIDYCVVQSNINKRAKRAKM